PISISIQAPENVPSVIVRPAAAIAPDDAAITSTPPPPRPAPARPRKSHTPHRGPVRAAAGNAPPAAPVGTTRSAVVVVRVLITGPPCSPARSRRTRPTPPHSCAPARRPAPPPESPSRD